MHSSPIDLLVRAPEQPKNPTPDSESDGRFSDLLRRPADAEAKPPAADLKERPAETMATPGQDAPATEESVRAASGPARAEAGMATDNAPVIEALAAIPGAITHAAPTPTVPTPNASVEAAAPVSPTAADVPSGLQLPAIPPPAVGTLTGDPASQTAPVPSVAGGQGTGEAGAQPRASAPAPVAGNVAPAATPSPVAPAGPTPSSDPAEPGPNLRAAGIETAKASTAASGAGIKTNPDIIAGSNASLAPLETASTNGSMPSLQALSAATKAPASLPRTTATEPSTLPESSELGDTADPVDLPAATAAGGAARKSGSGAPANPGQANALATPAGDRLAAATPTPSTRLDAASADLPAPTAQPDAPAAAASTQTARPAMEAVALAQSAGTNATPPPAAEQIVLQLRRAVADGIDRLTVQLKPASLGRVDVQMEVGHDGRLQAVISAERPETLHLLQRDARALTMALNDAGLQTDSGSLSFNLRGQSGDQAGGNDRLADDGAPVSDDVGADDGDDAIAPITLTLGAGRVDIKV